MGTLLVVLWLRHAGYVHQHKYDQMTLTEISARARVKFPPSSKLLAFKPVVRFDLYEIFLKLEMSRADADAFVASLSKGKEVEEVEISRTDHSEIDRRLHRHAPEWWRTETVRKFAFVRPLHRYNMLLVDLDNPEKAIVYFYWAH